jgi:hypothetical protein
MTRRFGRTGSVTQYGVQTPHSSRVLTVTADRCVAEHTLELIPDGRIVHRTITFSTWLPDTEEHDDDADVDRTG